VGVEKLHEVGGADAAVAAGCAEGGEPSLVHPLVDGAGVDLQQRTDLVGGEQAISIYFLLSHDLEALPKKTFTGQVQKRIP
jgi:hypothetical protein